MSDQTIVLPGPLLLVGCGKMGGALLRGWLGRGIAGKDVFVVDPAPRDLDDVQARGVTIVPAIDGLPAGLQPAIVLLAIKPQFMDEALPAYRRFAQKATGPGTVFLSIAAGKTVAYLKDKLGGDAAVVRSMPNTPAAVSRGMSVILRDPNIPAATLDLCGQLLSAVGKVGWIDEEDQINAVTALSGGGPAYVFLLIECLAEAGRAAGLPADLAMQLARETVTGSGELAHRSSDSATRLREAVMSPKGTTIEALAILMAPDGLQPLMTKAIAAATRRGREIAEGNAMANGAEPKGSVARVREALARHGLETEIKEFDASTRTSADAAAAIGCTVAQIAKSVVFRAKAANQPILVIASGTNRVDEKKLEAALGGKVGRADADFVRAATGFAIGGVAPVGHTGPVRVFIDADLDRYEEIWAAAGSPNAVFRLTPADLRRITGGQVISVK